MIESDYSISTEEAYYRVARILLPDFKEGYQFLRCVANETRKVVFSPTGNVCCIFLGATFLFILVAVHGERYRLSLFMIAWVEGLSTKSTCTTSH